MGQKRTASMAEVDSPKDRPSAANIRRERKRAIDRESQRLSRARTRAYIAQLEQTIEELNHSKSSTAAAETPVSISQLKQQCEENRRLKAMIGRIHRMTQEVATSSVEQTSDHQASHDSPEKHDSARSHQSRDGASECSATPPAEHEFHHENPIAEKSEPSPFDFREQHGVPTFNDSLRNNAWHIALASMSQDTGLLENHFEEVTNYLIQLELSDPALTYTGAEEDEDIVLRACLHGWDEAKKRHIMDSVWAGIETIDRAVFYRARPVERVASLHLLRTMVMHKIAPFGQPRRQIPTYMAPTKLQTSVEHARLIDYLVWSDLRDALISANAQFASELSTTWFATHVRLEWQYRAQDVCKYNVARDLYCFSADFEKTFHDSDAWISPYGSHDLRSVDAMSKTFRLDTVESSVDMDLLHLGLVAC